MLVQYCFSWKGTVIASIEYLYSSGYASQIMAQPNKDPATRNDFANDIVDDANFDDGI